MANTVLTPSIIAKEAALQVVNNLQFARLANKEFKNDFGVKIGDTVTYRKPVRFTAKSGAVLQLQDVNEKSDTIVINSRFHTAWEFSSQELTLKIDDYSERYIKPAAISLANQIDVDGAKLYKAVFNTVGAGSTTPDFPTLLNARQKMNEFAVPQNDRFVALNPAASNGVMQDLTAYFQPSLIEDITKEAALGRVAMMDVYETQNVQKHTKGTAVTANLSVNTTPLDGDSTIDLNESAAGTLVQGDILTFSGVNAVNPITKQDTGSLQQFVVNANYTLHATNPTLVSISPSLILTGPYQTVTALPVADSSTVTIFATHTANMAWQRNAFALVTVPLVAPQGAVWAETVEYQGLGMRFLRAFDVTNDVEIVRLDVMYGWKATYPELACRIAS